MNYFYLLANSFFKQFAKNQAAKVLINPVPESLSSFLSKKLKRVRFKTKSLFIQSQMNQGIKTIFQTK
jgi:hypothetical protein